MSKKTNIKERALIAALLAALDEDNPTPARADVQSKARYLNKVFKYGGSLDAIIEEVLIVRDTRMGEGVSLIDIQAEHDEEWVFKREIDWIYSNAYREYLREGGWAPAVVETLSNVSTKLLGHLQDPKSGGAWDRRGLVIGHVQSGKTASYMGLISKAADAGYRFIVVIAGIHNNLRKQTQERIDEGFVGRSSDPDSNKIRIGVGRNGQYPHPVTFTNIHSDFNKHTANQVSLKIKDFNKPMILVIKKNVSTLNSLHHWLKTLNAEGRERISDVPMLMIDDEADHASINTNREDLDPTKTNALLRKILRMFDKSCYVGYTATPFANIFINHDAYHTEVHEDLFPKNFIYCLDAPTSYFGPEKLFLEDESSGLFLRGIADAEPYIPFSHKKNAEILALPPSLYRAIRQFVVARTIRNLRGHGNKHCSMMINVSRFVAVQNVVKSLVSESVNKMRNAVKANYLMPDNVSSRNEHIAKLKDIFDAEFRNCGFDWHDVKQHLFETLANNFRIFLVNSRSDEALDYRKYETEGTGLTAIAVGGLSLSRGLTIEGLCVSYMYRNTRMYDTLMQMGRWFGYRPDYEDLCRIYLSEDSINWYAHISSASEELMQQIKRMRRDNISPVKFGLYVMAHPDRLLVTAANKMRSGEVETVKQNFSGQIRESYILPADKEANQKNHSLIQSYLRNGFHRGAENVEETGKGLYIPSVRSEIVGEFLYSFNVYEDYRNQRDAHIKYLEAISEKFNTCDILLISPSNGSAQVSLNSQIRKQARLTDGRWWRVGKDRVASRGDEKLGLTKQQQQRAKKIAAKDGKQPSDIHYRTVREKPLLMLHSLDLGDGTETQKKVCAYGISFPLGDYSEGIDVVVNKVWIDQMHGDTIDVPDEEDYDE